MNGVDVVWNEAGTVCVDGRDVRGFSIEEKEENLDRIYALVAHCELMGDVVVLTRQTEKEAKDAAWDLLSSAGAYCPFRKPKNSP